MKKTITLAIIMAMLLVPLASAMSIPVPVSGTITTDGYAGGFNVKITNIRTDESMTVVTNPQGQYFISSWTNHFDTPKYEDVFRIEVDGNYKSVIYRGGAIEADFYLEVEGPTCPVCDPVDCPSCNGDCSCPDCPSCPSCPSCPTCPEDTTPYSSCSSCCESCDTCEECPTCPAPDANRAVEILLAALGGAAVSGAAVSLTLGKIAQHYHRGIVNKHSIYTRHRNPLIRHPIGEVAPAYAKDSTGKYVYVPKEDR